MLLSGSEIVMSSPTESLERVISLRVIVRGWYVISSWTVATGRVVYRHEREPSTNSKSSKGAPVSTDWSIVA